MDFVLAFLSLLCSLVFSSCFLFCAPPCILLFPSSLRLLGIYHVTYFCHLLLLKVSLCPSMVPFPALWHTPPYIHIQKLKPRVYMRENT